MRTVPLNRLPQKRKLLKDVRHGRDSPQDRGKRRTDISPTKQGYNDISKDNLPSKSADTGYVTDKYINSKGTLREYSARQLLFVTRTLIVKKCQKIVVTFTGFNSEKFQETISRLFWFILIPLLVWIFMAGFISSVNNWSLRQKEMAKSIQRLQEVFPSQKREFWNIIRSGMRNLLYEEEPEKPFVLLIIHNPETKSKSISLARNISVLFAELLGDASKYPITITVADVGKSVQEEPQELWDKISSHFHLGYNVALIESLLDLPIRKVFKLLHALCDTTEAPFKRVMYIFLVERTRTPSMTYCNSNKFAGDILKCAWQGELNRDEYPSLISRLTDSVVEVI